MTVIQMTLSAVNIALAKIETKNIMSLLSSLPSKTAII